MGMAIVNKINKNSLNKNREAGMFVKSDLTAHKVV